MTDQVWSVGLDLSLTSTGIAAIECESGSVFSTTVTSKGKADASLADQWRRLGGLRSEIVDKVNQVRPSMVVVESAFFGTRHDSSAHRRAGLWWQVVGELLNAGYPVIPVAPTEVKKFATGKGNCTKDAVVARCVTVWGEKALEGSFNDAADALFLAAIGAFTAGHAVGLEDTIYRKKIVEQIRQRTAVLNVYDSTLTP